MAEKKVFHFRAAGGFADTGMYHLAAQARKHAQKLAKDLGRVVRYYMTGGVHHSVKPPKANPCKRKKTAGKGKNPAPQKKTLAQRLRSIKVGDVIKVGRNYIVKRTRRDSWRLEESTQSPLPGARLMSGTAAEVAARVKTGRPKKKNPAGIGDWVGVKGAKAVRVRRVKGATLLDIKR